MAFLFNSEDADMPDLFGEQAGFDGDGQWYMEPYHAIRTVRPGLPVVFVVNGAVNPVNLPIDQENAFLAIHNKRAGGGQNLDRSVNLYNWEYLYVTFAEPFTNMAAGHAAGKADLIAQINLLEAGQKFAFIGLSEGAAVASDVYDEIRTGSLTGKATDFLGAFCAGNPRRENGITFTDPTYGLFPDPLPGSSGAATVRLTGTESKWWEICTADDPVTCVSDSSDLGWWIRRFYELVHQPGGTTQAAIIAEVKANVSGKADGQTAIDLFRGLATTGHVKYKDRIPFSALGDTRTFMQVGVDYINSLSTEVATPVLHQIRSDSRPVTPGQFVTAGAQLRWWNFPTFAGTSIKTGVSAYNAAGDLISDMTTAPGSVLKNVKPDNKWGWKTLTGRYKMPAQAVVAKLLVEIAPEVMGTGIAWFREPRLRV